MNLLTSLVRTYVPIAVGFLVSWISLLGITVTDDQKAVLVSLLGSLVSAAYYLVARLLERKFPWATVLLGSSKQPVAYAPAARTADTVPAHLSDGEQVFTAAGTATAANLAALDHINKHEAPEA